MVRRGWLGVAVVVVFASAAPPASAGLLSQVQSTTQTVGVIPEYVVPLHAVAAVVPTVAPSEDVSAGCTQESVQEDPTTSQTTSTCGATSGTANVTCTEFSYTQSPGHYYQEESLRCQATVGETSASAGCAGTYAAGGGVWETDVCGAGPVSYSEQQSSSGPDATSSERLEIGDLAIQCERDTYWTPEGLLDCGVAP